MRWRGLAQSRDTVPPISQRQLRRSTTDQDQEHSQRSGRDQLTGWLGALRAVARAFLFANGPGLPPSLIAPSISSAGVAQSFLSPIDRGCPQPKGSSFPFADRLRAFFSARDSGFPLRHSLKSFPFAGWLRGPPLRASPSPGGTERFPRPEALESAQYRVARGFPRTGGLESPPRRWPGVSPAPVAWSFLLAGGAGLLLAEAPSCPLPGGSGFPFAGSRPWW